MSSTNEQFARCEPVSGQIRGHTIRTLLHHEKTA